MTSGRVRLRPERTTTVRGEDLWDRACPQQKSEHDDENEDEKFHRTRDVKTPLKIPLTKGKKAKVKSLEDFTRSRSLQGVVVTGLARLAGHPP